MPAKSTLAWSITRSLAPGSCIRIAFGVDLAFACFKVVGELLLAQTLLLDPCAERAHQLSVCGRCPQAHQGLILRIRHHCRHAIPIALDDQMLIFLSHAPKDFAG